MEVGDRAGSPGFLNCGLGCELLGVVRDLRAPGSLTGARNAAAHGRVVAVNPMATTGVGQDGRGTAAASAGGSMGGSSSRLATATAVALGLGVLVVAGRLLSTGPSARPPATTAVSSVVTAPAAPSSASTTRGVLVPQAIGRTLAQATTVMRATGLPSGASDRDPQASSAVVVAQEPPAGLRVPPNSPVGFRTRSDVWPNGTPRRLRLGRGPTTATYRVVAADPVRASLTVVMTMPPAVELQVWLETGPSRSVPVLDTTIDSRSCRPANRRSRCLVRFAALEAEEPGVWIVSLAKRSARAAAIQVTVTFTQR